METKIKFSILFCLLVSQITLISAQNETPKLNIKDVDKSMAKVTDSLYANKFEVTNLLYRTFVQDLRNTHQTELIKIATVDSTVWVPNPGFSNSFNSGYHRHYWYNNYPAVGISYDAAILFCKWLTDKYNSNSRRKFKKVSFKLPTEIEWEMAARGCKRNLVYPWGNRLRNPDGMLMCNFQYIGDEKINYDSLNNKFVVDFRKTPYIDDSFIPGSGILRHTENVDYYYPNNIGLYNIVGNVAEMVNEKGISRGGSWKSSGGDVQIKSRAFYSKPTNELGFRFFMVVIEK